MKESPSGWNATLRAEGDAPSAIGIVREVPSATEIAMYPPPSSAWPRIVVPSGLRSPPKNGGGVSTRTRSIDAVSYTPTCSNVVDRHEDAAVL